MARGQDAPTRTGGGIDPYVQSSMQQNKQLAGNRLTTAMQEKGATERANIASGTQLKSQQMQSQTALQVEAARSASDDKRAAEAERGRREDNEVTERLAEANQLFETKRDSLRKEHELLLEQNRMDEAEKVRMQRKDLAFLEMEIAADAADRAANVDLSIAKMMVTGDADREKMVTTVAEEGKKELKNQRVHAKVMEDVTRRIKLDKRWDFPVREPRPAFRGAGAGMTYALPKEDDLFDPVGIMQDQLVKYNPNLEVANLNMDNIHKLEQQLVDKKIRPEDIRSTFGAVMAMRDALTEKALGVSTKKEADFYRKQIQLTEDAEESLLSLKNSKRLLKDEKNQTVSFAICSALGGVYPELTTGNKVNKLRESGKNWDEVIDDLTKGRKAYPTAEIRPGMSPYAVQLRNDMNAIFERKGVE